MLEALHQYHLHTDPAVQTKILQILTVLIQLGVNYAQLDEDSVSLTYIFYFSSLRKINQQDVYFVFYACSALPQDSDSSMRILAT